MDTVGKDDATVNAKPHCIHAIGIGRTGAAYIEALFRTGEIEDLLSEPGTSFAALLIDIGDEDIQIPNDYGRSLKARLVSRNIPADRFHYESIALSVPTEQTFVKELTAVRAQLKKEGASDPWANLPKDYKLPAAGGHIPRSIAKAIYSINYYLGDRKLDAALQRFSDHVNSTDYPSTVLLAFGMAGGTGSGIAIDLARHVSFSKLDSKVKVVGVGQASHSGDSETYNNLTQYMAIEDIDRAIHSTDSNASKPNPFTGGFFVVSSEQSWQRLTAYTSTGLKDVRQNFKQMVTNRFVADSFMRFAVGDHSKDLLRVLGHGVGKYTLFDVAKLSHPGVQVLPGESRSKWDAVLHQWIGFIPKYSGLSDKFKTDYAEVQIHAAREMQRELLDADFKEVVSSNYLNGDKSTYVSSWHEFFDVLTAYGNVILPGAEIGDLVAYNEAKSNFKKIDATQKALEQV